MLLKILSHVLEVFVFADLVVKCGWGTIVQEIPLLIHRNSYRRHLGWSPTKFCLQSLVLQTRKLFEGFHNPRRRSGLPYFPARVLKNNQVGIESHQLSLGRLALS